MAVVRLDPSRHVLYKNEVARLLERRTGLPVFACWYPLEKGWCAVVYKGDGWLHEIEPIPHNADFQCAPDREFVSVFEWKALQRFDWRAFRERLWRAQSDYEEGLEETSDAAVQASAMMKKGVRGTARERPMMNLGRYKNK